MKKFMHIFDRRYIIYKDGIILPQNFPHYQRTFSTFAWEAVCRSRITFCERAEGPVTNALFTALKKTDPASNRANIYGILTISASQTSMNIYQTGAFRTKKFNGHSLPSTSSHMIRHLHCYCVEHTWLTGAPMILVEMDVVAIRWVRQKLYPGPHLKEKKIGWITFVPTFVLSNSGGRFFFQSHIV